MLAKGVSICGSVNSSAVVLAAGFAIFLLSKDSKAVAAFYSRIFSRQRSSPGGHTSLILLAFLWLLLFLKKCCTYLLRSLSHILLSSQALEYILVASGDVEENPGPTYFTGMFLIVSKIISHASHTH